MEENQKNIQVQENNSQPQVLDLVFQKTKGKGLKYQKINKEKTKILRNIFHETPYPTKLQYESLSNEFLIPLNKIVNWFKFQRKEFLKIGKIKAYKKRRILNKEEETILEENFRENTNPTPMKFQELAKLLNCKKRQVRNWFAYRRKKLNKISNKGSQKLNLRNKNKDMNFQIFNDENMEKSSSMHSNDDNLADKVSTESTSNQNTKKENSNDSGKNENTQENKDRNLYPQKMLNKSQFYLPNQDQHQNHNSNDNQKEFKQTSEIKNMGNNNNVGYSGANYMQNNNFIGGFQQQSFQNPNQFMGQISYIPYKVVPFNQFMQPAQQPNYISIPTLAYLPMMGPQNYYSNQINPMAQINQISPMTQITQMNQMPQINQMNQMNPMNPMNQMNQINPMNPMNQMNQMNKVNQINQMQMVQGPMYPQIYASFNGGNVNLGNSSSQMKENSSKVNRETKNVEKREG